MDLTYIKVKLIRYVFVGKATLHCIIDPLPS